MIDVNELKFDESGLIPAILVDVDTGEVLTHAYMNIESLEISLNEGRTCFWSRSRNELWRKGETSGNVQEIVSIRTDCDKDALVIVVKASGPACHTGADSCFFEHVHGEHGEKTSGRSCQEFSLQTLYDIVSDRKVNKKRGSYTTYLFEKGIDKILKKFGEESAEVLIAGKAGDNTATIYELADLTYHIMVLMAELGITPDDVLDELISRHNEDAEHGGEKAY